MVNVITMLTPNHPGDGCFAVIPGSHKKNFTLDYGRWGRSGLDMPGAVEITGEPGDVMVMTEALVHTGSAKTTSRRWTTLQYNHVHSRLAAGFCMFDDPGGTGLHNSRHTWMPPSIRERFTEEQKALTEYMDYTLLICLCPTLRMTHDHPTLIKEAPSELLEHERRHRHSITGSRIRMLRLLKRGEAKGVREAGELIGYSWRHTRRWLTTY